MADSIREQVVLVNERDEEIGRALKATLHTNNTPLHRAFSLYLFAPDGEILVQQRNRGKKTWGGFWSNSCCGHPFPEETRQEALLRRTKEELGSEPQHIEKILDYRYRFEHNSIVENEVCPVFVGLAPQKEVVPNANEIEAVKWMPWSEFLRELKERKDAYSPWSQEQAQLLLKSSRFHDWLQRHNIALN